MVASTLRFVARTILDPGGALPQFSHITSLLLTMATRKLLINDPSAVVRDYLMGLVSMNSHLRILDSFNVRCFAQWRCDVGSGGA